MAGDRHFPSAGRPRPGDHAGRRRRFRHEGLSLSRTCGGLPARPPKRPGRPEAAYVLERIFDAASRELGIAPDELRRRNFIPPDAMPFATPVGANYDSGEFENLMRQAMESADWSGAAARKAEARARGKR